MDEDPTAGTHGQAETFEVWSSSGAIEYMAATDCGSNASGGTLRVEVVDAYDK